ncbi:protein rolling stone-like isoform X2 [Odontomachus brunneus]|uniref:protein rolling stone-like isoform X2 n=1 Tax=Odontomachus brunneus TaxID=486640 RepID=UPI0013F1812C|nr:protein rolling stone-like isoform X2 [Odontomachus brunneus]
MNPLLPCVRMVLAIKGLPLLRQLLQCSSYRRAMVSKFWCQEISRRWRQRRQETPHARLLTEPKCQSHVTIWYLFYRWIVFLIWTAFVVCSLFELGSYQPLRMYDKWPIYLTHWDVALGFSQALIGGILVLKRWRLQRIPGFNPCNLRLEFTERLYWFLYVVTTNIAIGVTVCYWLAVYNPEIHYLDPLNIMMHVCNSVLMLIDLFVTSIPFRLRNFWWSLSIAMFYVMFTVIYYAAGGLNKEGYPYIYKILDWKKPARTIPLCAGGLTLVTVLHCVLCMLAHTRDRLYRRITGKLNSRSVHITTNEKSLTGKRTEMV